MVRYVVTELGTLGGASSYAFAINASGVVVGKAQSRDGVWRAVMWTEGSTVDLGRLPGTTGSEARGINAAGQVVGMCLGRTGGACRPFLWQDEEMVDLGDLGGSALAADINASGQVVGGSFTGPKASTAQHRAVLWLDNGSALVLPGGQESHAWGVNDTGLAVGVSQTGDGTDRAVLWRDDEIRDLGTLGGADAGASAINERGAIVGAARTRDGALHAFMWLDDTMTDLGAPEGARRSRAFGINASGEVVGAAATPLPGRELCRACLWRDGTLFDLNALIGGVSGWELGVACDINDRGQIVGAGLARGVERAFLLAPAT